MTDRIADPCWDLKPHPVQEYPVEDVSLPGKPSKELKSSAGKLNSYAREWERYGLDIARRVCVLEARLRTLERGSEARAEAGEDPKDPRTNPTQPPPPPFKGSGMFPKERRTSGKSKKR